MPTFYDRFVECAERWPDNVALELQRQEQLETCTYAELRRMAESVGRWIIESKFPRGSRLAILADNHPRWVAAYLGIIASGCAVVPLDTALYDDQVTKLLKDSGTAAIFCDLKHVPTARPATTELKIGIILTDPTAPPIPAKIDGWRIFRRSSARDRAISGQSRRRTMIWLHFSTPPEPPQIPRE